MSISTGELILALAIALTLGGILAYLFWKQRKAALTWTIPASSSRANTNPLVLQAYERMILLTERIALPALIQRMHQPGLALKEMQAILTQTIRDEFEHNITQQIYVSAYAWDAVKNLKDQNLMIIHQVASFLPNGATGDDLNKSILEMLHENPNAALHDIVAEVLKTEARKLI